MALRGTLALAWAFLIETWRAKAAIFWNLAFPLIFIVGFPIIFGGGDAEQIGYIVPGVMALNLIAAAFFGITMTMVSLRESGLYRRFRATPLRSLSVVTAHGLTSLVNILISLAIQLVVAKLVFQLEIRGNPVQLLGAFVVSAFALIPLGLIVGSVARDMKSAPAIGNILFFPLAFLSGAAMPLFLMPDWLQQFARLLPTTYVVEMMRGAVAWGEGPWTMPAALLVLLLTGLIGLAFNAALFRWESEDRLDRRPLLATLGGLALVSLAVFFADVDLRSAMRPAGGFTAGLASPEDLPNPAEADDVEVFVGMTVLDGQGGRLENARLVIRGERIVELVPHDDSPAPDDVVVHDLRGTFLVPGLIDSHVYVGGSAGGSASGNEYLPRRVLRDLQVYLALGITAVVSMTDDIDDLRRLRAAVDDGTMRAPRPYFAGAGITAPKGHPAIYFAQMPGLAERMTRQVTTADEASAAVREMADLDVDLVMLYLDEGPSSEPVPRLSEPALRAAIDVAHGLDLTATVHVDSDAHARLAVDAGADHLAHTPPDLSRETIRLMLEQGVTLSPTLAAVEGMAAVVRGEIVDDPIARQWVDPAIFDSLLSSRSWIAEIRGQAGSAESFDDRQFEITQSTCRAIAEGVQLLPGSDAGSPAAFHGAGLLRELVLLVEDCGMSPANVFLAATGQAAARLGSREIGQISTGAFADFLVLEADPTEDIRALTEPAQIWFRGQPLDRDRLLESPPGSWMPGR